MSLIERQISKAIVNATVEAYTEGRQPDLEEIGAAIRDVTKDASGVPTMKVRNQRRKKLFNIEAFNTVLNDTEFDLEVLYEEMISLVASTMRRLNMVTVSYAAQSQQLETVIAHLNSLLFTIQNADDNFFGIFDNFESLNKIDQDNTTPLAVDLQERACSLPANSRTGTKIKMSHLYNRTSWPVQIDVGDRRLIRSSSGQNAGFGNAFSDMNSVWRQDVFVSDPGNVVMTFDIEVSPHEGQEIYVNRIQLIPHGTKPVSVTPLYSTDGINFLKIRGVDSGIRCERQAKTYNLDFATTRVQQLRFIVTRNDYDEQLTDGSFRYSIGFKHIGLYAFGRQTNSQVSTKVLTPVGMSRPIDKVSLQVKEQIPEGTKIDYSIALADSDGQPIGDYRAITPSNRSQGVAPSVIRFGNSSRRSVNITSDTGPLLSVETVRAIEFFALPLGVVSGDNYIFGSAKLYRGFGGWNRNTKQDRVLRQVRDSYISFNAGDIQNLYAVVTNEAGPEEAYQTFPGGGQGDVLQTALRVQHNIDYDSLSMSLIPPSNVDVVIDQRPNYAIYRVLRFRSIMSIEDEEVVLNGEQNTLLSEANPSVGLDDRPIVKNAAKTITYSEGIDYTVGQDSAGRPDGNIARITSGLIGDGDTLAVSYTLNPDITHLADAARDNLLYLSTLLGITEDDRFEVTYRFVPKAPNNTIIKNTNVTERYGDSVQGDVYEEGPDYSINTQQGTMTRIPSGRIGPSQGGDISAYVDFYYYETPDDVETYSTWIFQPSRSPVKFGYSALSLNKTRGERFILNMSSGSVDLTDMVETPEIPYGWHQFIVKSLKPETFGNAAILAITALKDVQNDYIFIRGGKYFSEIQSNRNPMREVTLGFLQTSVVPTNYDNFAIDQYGRIVINFQPGTTSDLYMRQVRYDPEASGADANGFAIGFYPEEFLLEYRFQIETEEELSSSLLLRAVLSRKPGSDGALTPKLHSYDIRVG